MRTANLKPHGCGAQTKKMIESGEFYYGTL
jgi:hypothetical protein